MEREGSLRECCMRALREGRSLFIIVPARHRGGQPYMDICRYIRSARVVGRSVGVTRFGLDAACDRLIEAF